MALGQGWAFYMQVIVPEWRRPLADLAERERPRPVEGCRSVQADHPREPVEHLRTRVRIDALETLWWRSTLVSLRIRRFVTQQRIFREHAALSATSNDGKRAFDLGGLGDTCDRDYAAMAPVQWPVPRVRRKGRRHDLRSSRQSIEAARQRIEEHVDLAAHQVRNRQRGAAVGVGFDPGRKARSAA